MKINPQIEIEINNCVKALRGGELIIFPDETGWSIGCDASRADLVTAIIKSENYSFPVLLLDEAGRLNKFVKVIPDPLWDLVEFSSRPTNIILSKVVNLPSIHLDEDGAAVFRIVKDAFCRMLTHKFGKPLFAAQLNEQVKPGKGTTHILNTPAYVVNLRIAAATTPLSLVIIRLSEGSRIEFIKK